MGVEPPARTPSRDHAPSSSRTHSAGQVRGVATGKHDTLRLVEVASPVAHHDAAHVLARAAVATVLLQGGQGKSLPVPSGPRGGPLGIAADVRRHVLTPRLSPRFVTHKGGYVSR